MTPSEFREAIASLDLDQTEAAKFLKVGRRTAVRWAVNGRIPFAVGALLRLMKRLGIRPRDLPKMIDD